MSIKHSPEQETGNETGEAGNTSQFQRGKNSPGNRDDSFKAKAENIGQDAKRKVEEVVNKVKDSEAAHEAKDVSRKVQKQVGETGEEFKQSLEEVGHDVRVQAEQIAEDRKDQAASRLDTVASTLRHAGQEFEEQDESTLAHYTNSLAEQLDTFSHSLRDRDIGALIEDARQMAQRQPELFVTGALAIGFMVGRFLKSSTSKSRSREFDRLQNGAQQNSGQQYGRQQDGRQQYGRQQFSGQSSEYNRPFAGQSGGQGASMRDNAPINGMNRTTGGNQGQTSQNRQETASSHSQSGLDKSKMPANQSSETNLSSQIESGGQDKSKTTANQSGQIESGGQEKRDNG